MQLRDATPADIEHLARIWHEGWHDAHAAIVPAELTALRTKASFYERLASRTPDIRLAEEGGAPLGFCLIKADEIYQLFVARAARGSGVAIALIDDGEARLAARGYQTIWLGCAIGNDRAGAFYRKRGWRLARTMIDAVETSQGPFDVELWRFEKDLAGAPI